MQVKFTPPLDQAHTEIYTVFPVTNYESPWFELILSGPHVDQIYSALFHSFAYVNGAEVCSCKIVLASKDNVTPLNTLLDPTVELLMDYITPAEGATLQTFAQSSKREHIGLTAVEVPVETP